MGDLEGYITVGLYPDGRPGEVFLTLHKQGSLERGLCHTIALLTSILLQRGVPLEEITKKLRGICFEPSGLMGDIEIPSATSLVDFVAQWLELKFQTPKE